MLKSSCITLLLIYSTIVAYSQNPTLIINAAAISSGNVIVNASGYNFSTGFLMTPTITVYSGNSLLWSTSGNNTIPVNRFTVAVVRNSTVGRDIILSTDVRSITGSTAGLSNFYSGAFSVRYKTLNQSSFAWQAGDYSTDLNYGASSYGWGTSVSPDYVILNVSVTPLINVLAAPNDINISVNNLNFFRSTQASVNQNTSYMHTLPLLMSVKSNSNQFTFSGGQSGLPGPKTNVNLVQTSVQSPAANSPVFISSTFQPIYSGSVPVGNITSPVEQFVISPDNLKVGFMNKGTYTTMLSLENKDQSGSYSVSYTKSFNLKVTVDDLSELGINTSTIDLKFNTADNYRNGVSVDVNNHLIVSKTLPFDLSVKSSSANFVSGTNTIPVSILSIGPANGQQGVNIVSSVTTQDQKLINAGSVGVDTPISLRYSIPASQTINLLNKKAGIYTTDVIYTLTTH